MTIFLPIFVSFQCLVGVYGEAGSQLFGLHYSGGPVIGLKEKQFFTSVRGGRLGYTGGASLPYLDSLGSSFSYSGWVAEVSAGWEWKFKKGCLTQGLGIFAGISANRMWVGTKYDPWEWETSWAVHLGISAPFKLSGCGKSVTGDIYWIGWLDPDLVAQEPVGYATLTTPIGFGGDFWLFKWGLDSLKNEEKQKEDQP
ncbi:MAG: hypothetical protein ACP5QG_09495 [candidate division WOR-3 bacterium]